MTDLAVLPPVARSALRPLACAMVAFAVLPAKADLISLTGPRFDILYDNASFIFDTGFGIQEQLGGLSIVGPNTVRYTMRPVRVEQSGLPGVPPEIEYRNFIQVGGPFVSDLLVDGAFFGLRPKDGNGVLSVRMLTAGRFSNPNREGVDLVYSEQLAAGGAVAQRSEFLGGEVPSGALPSGSQVDFAAPLVSPFGVKFDYSLSGFVRRTVGSTSDANADIRYVDLEIATVSAPIPEPGTWLLMLAGLAGIGALAHRRRA